MKKVLLIVFLYSAMCTLPCFALSEQGFDEKMNILTLEVYKLAENILAFNEYAFESKLTKDEQVHSLLWNRVCEYINLK